MNQQAIQPFPEFTRVRSTITGRVGTVCEAPAGCHLDTEHVVAVKWDDANGQRMLCRVANLEKLGA